MANHEIVKMLVIHGLKVTPQRLAVLEVLMNLGNHPDAETIIRHIRINLPNTSAGTVYKILDAFTEKGLITQVKTGNDVIRYDAIPEKHHHLFSPDSERLEDFYDDKLFDLIDKYLKKNKIPGFEVKDIRLQLIGSFKGKKE
jgi:Fur family peroxide stress response transcriptional regulator